MTSNGSARVADNLEHADATQGLVPVAETAGGHGVPHIEPSALGFDATGWVSIAMLVLIGVMLWKRVPAMIGAALDKKIAGIRENLDEAKRLRAEAEALKAEYEAKAATAAQESEAMIVHAREEADAILAQAKVDAATLIERRGRMAEDKIAAAERAAVAEVRARAAQIAAAAAATLIAEDHGAVADKALVNRTISTLGTQRLN